MNAIVGDNGIITNAQNANILQSCAALSEYLNELYVNDQLDDIIASNDDGTVKSAVEKMLDKYPNWFYSNGSNNYVIQEYTTKDADGNTSTGFIKLRLIRKNNLPDEIKNQVNGGNAVGASGTEDSLDAYEQLQDVFGVTGDLQVYYCSNGIASIQGADFASSSTSDSYDGTKTVYGQNSSMAQAIAQSNGTDSADLSMQDLRSVKDLTITDNLGINSLEALYDLPNLTKLTLKNYKGSLKGIERAYRLTNLYFENNDGSQNIDYVGLSGATKLTQLYVYMPTDSEIDKMITEMSKSNYTNLATLGLYGYMNSQSSDFTTVQNNGTRTTFTRADLLQNLTNTTKNAVTVLYINNNSITNLNLTGFINLSKIRANSNKINTMSLNTTKSLQLALNNNLLSSLDFIPSSMTFSYICLNSCGCSDLSTLTNKSLAISNFVDTDYPLTYLSDAGDTKTSIIAFINKISKVTISPKYNLLLTNSADMVIDSSITDNEFQALTGNQKVKRLYISGNKNITNATLQSVLKTLPNLTDLRASNTNLASLSFISPDGTFTQNTSKNNGCINLQHLAITGTNVTDISLLDNSKCKILTLWYNNDFDLSVYKNLTTRLFSGSGNGWEGGYFSSKGGLNTSSASTYKTLEKCTFLTKISNYAGMYPSTNVNVDLTALTGLTYFYTCSVSKISFKLPASVTQIGRIDGQVVDASLCTNLVYAYITNSTNATFPGNALKASFEYYTSTVANLKGTKKLDILSIGYSVPWCTYTNISSEGSTQLPETESVNTVTLRCINAKKVLEWVSNSVIHKELTIRQCKLNKIPTQNADSTIITLSLYDNIISSVSGIESYTDLVTLDLRYNTLSNYVTYIENGKSITKNTCEILASLPNLKTIYLTGNDGLTDYSALINAGFSQSSAGVFTK